jgi:hypothetical protein
MAVEGKWYGQAFANLVSGVANSSWDWDTDTIKVILADDTVAPAQDTWDFYNDVSNELATAGGYTQGGQALDNKTVTYDSASNETRLDADDESFTGLTLTTRYGHVYKDGAGASSTDPLIGYLDFNGNQTLSSSTLTLQWAATGIFKATAS